MTGWQLEHSSLAALRWLLEFETECRLWNGWLDKPVTIRVWRVRLEALCQRQG